MFKVTNLGHLKFEEKMKKVNFHRYLIIKIYFQKSRTNEK